MIYSTAFNCTCGIWKHNFEAILCVIFFLLWVPIFIALCVFHFLRGYGMVLIGTWNHFHYLLGRLLGVISLFLVSLIPAGLLLLWFLVIEVVPAIIVGSCLHAARYGYRFGLLEGMKALMRANSDHTASASHGLLNEHLYQKGFHVTCYFSVGLIGTLVVLLAQRLTHNVGT